MPAMSNLCGLEPRPLVSLLQNQDFSKTFVSQSESLWITRSKCMMLFSFTATMTVSLDQRRGHFITDSSGNC